ncbi:hypothetical protein B566_EDAN011169 [Ephemera danica]|nr:hypothetical protein B566_EDAN011169 [Ephemera danica]
MYFFVGVLFSTIIFQVLALETDNFKLENDTEALNRGLFGFIKPSACLATLNRLNIPSAATPALASASPLTRLANGRVYFFSPIAATASWTQARDYCTIHGMHLVTLETARENQLVYAQATALGLANAGGTGAWIGLRDMGLNDWRWIFRNTRPTYTAFNVLPVNPCGSYVKAAATAGNSWTTAVVCADPLPFICEMEPPCSAMAPAISV